MKSEKPGLANNFTAQLTGLESVKPIRDYLANQNLGERNL
jgi:hypothetical protein